MFQTMRNSLAVIGTVILMLTFIACGGSGGGSDVTYNGSTDPAVADSSTSTTLTEYGLGVVQAGSPLAEAFLAEPEMVPTALAAGAVPLGAYTTLTIPVPPDAVIDGEGYNMGGSGTATLKGTMTLYVNAASAESNTWNVEYGVLHGSIVFNGFSVNGGPTLTGTVTVPDGGFYFSGEAVYSLSDGNFTSDPGLPMWSEVAMTFTNLTVSTGDDSWSLGEGDWFMELSPGEGAYIYINSMTVLYDGSAYKLEDAQLTINLYPGEGTEYDIAGDSNDYATFYHPALGKVWFDASVGVGEATGEIDFGGAGFYDGPSELDNQLVEVEFTWDDGYGDSGATAYWIGVYLEEVDLYGYIVDGVYTPDPDAMYAFP